MKKEKLQMHADEEWINKKGKGKGHGFSYDGTKNGRAKIFYMCSANRLQIVYYNFILLLKYIYRKYK